MSPDYLLPDHNIHFLNVRKCKVNNTLPAIKEREKSTTLNLFLNLISTERRALSLTCLFSPPGNAFLKRAADSPESVRRKPSQAPTSAFSILARFWGGAPNVSTHFSQSGDRWSTRVGGARLWRSKERWAVASWTEPWAAALWEPPLPGLQLGERGTGLRLELGPATGTPWSSVCTGD